jgi:hypothetical protein
LADTRRTKRRNGANSAVMDPPPKPETPPTAAAPAPEPPPRQHISRFKTFQQAMAAIAAPDWGKRAKVTLYRLEPVIDQLRQNSVKYIEIYPHPVDEDRIKRDYGSGKYRLMLTFKKPGAGLSDELDAIEFDILDMNFPPKVPEGAWVDDHRNVKWAWAKQFFKSNQPTPPPVPDILEQLDKLDQLQDRAVARAQANAPAPQPDMSTSALGLAERILSITQGGGQAAYMQMFGEELRHSREQNATLQAELRAILQKPAPAPVDPIELLANSADKFKKIKEVLSPDDNGLISERLKSKMNGWQEFGVTLAEKAFASPWMGNVFTTLAQVAYAKSLSANGAGPPVAMQPNGNGAHVNGASVPSSVSPNQMQQLTDFVNYFAAPMLNHFGDDMSGGDFADWIFNGHGKDWIHPSGVAVPWIEAAHKIGSANLLKFYQQSPYWPSLLPKAARFETFLQEFCAWNPEEDEEDDSEPELIRFDEVIA